MGEHADILIGVVSTLFFIIIGLIAWQGRRQIMRIDGVEKRLTVIEKNTNEAVNEMKDNYKSEFVNVRKDISELKEANAIHFGDLKCAITELRAKFETKNGRSKS